jgi:hypothetical protein
MTETEEGEPLLAVTEIFQRQVCTRKQPLAECIFSGWYLPIAVDHIDP